MRRSLLAALTLGTAACATAPAPFHPTATVQAVAETEPVGSANEDAADDPAIWRNRADPSASLIVATDKKSGLLVYDLAGRKMSGETSGLINNVDLAELPDGRVVVIASDRNDNANARLRAWQLDTTTGALRPLGTVPGGSGEAYGLCLRADGDGVRAFSALKSGVVEEYRLTFEGGTVAGTHLRTRSIPTQIEGCVADPRDGTLYIAEEDAGIWRFPAEGIQGELVAAVDNRVLHADVEGLALVAEGSDGGLLIASSQGDNAYAIFRLPGMEPLGRFRIGKGKFGATEETDGIALDSGDFGAAFPGGLFVAQDGMNAPRAQNFKLVSWEAVRKALGL